MNLPARILEDPTLSPDDLVHEITLRNPWQQVKPEDDRGHVYDGIVIDNEHLSYVPPKVTGVGGDNLDYEKLLSKHSLLEKLHIRSEVLGHTLNLNQFRLETNSLYLATKDSGEDIFMAFPSDARNGHRFLCKHGQYDIATATAWEKENYRCTNIQGTVSYGKDSVLLQMLTLFTTDNFPMALEIAAFTIQSDRRRQSVRVLNYIIRIPNIERGNKLVLFYKPNRKATQPENYNIAGSVFSTANIVFDAISKGNWHLAE